ncbi:MAG: nitroreductase family protein [Bacteroidales bacterium]|nr:nitroreductase family protein [Bacteroidales bacterium]
MADNYLEKRYEETLGASRPKVKSIGHTVDDLLLRNRSHRAFLSSYKVSRAELERIVSVCSRIPSGCNRQALRFHLLTYNTGGRELLPLIKLGAALPQLHLPLPNTEPEAFIICCATVDEDRLIDIDLGIALQSMMLKAVEMGLNALTIGAFNAEKVQKTFSIALRPLMILAIGKGIDRIALTSISPEQNHSYYRENGIHYVPKIVAEKLILNHDA